MFFSNRGATLRAVYCFLELEHFVYKCKSVSQKFKFEHSPAKKKEEKVLFLREIACRAFRFVPELEIRAWGGSFGPILSLV